MKLFDDLKWRGLIKDITSDDLEQKLNEETLTFYWGTDPSAESLHLGHLSSLLTAKRLKDAGHHPILLVGGATGLIGDPRPSKERQMITKESLLKNYEGIKNQITTLFGYEIVNNYDWSKEINFIDFLRDYGKYFNVNYMLDKDIIKRRLENGITYTEFSYMIMQALDFLYLYENKNCQLQVEGSDQWGNITAGVELIRKKIGKEAYGFTMPLVTDASGNKFGKSEGNALWLDKNKTSSYELYQFLVNVEDEMVISYLKIFTFLSKDEIEQLAEDHLKNPHLRHAHRALAQELITFIHGTEEYLKALKISQSLFSGNFEALNAQEIKEALKDVPNFKFALNDNVLNVLINNNICISKREAREFIANHSITINNKKIIDENYLITNKDLIGEEILIIRRGKKKYYLGIK
ncbi:MAG: tyrosine--tRNA ligase [Bacilli bacterium]